MKQFFHNVKERIKSQREGRRNTVYEIEVGSSELKVRWLTMENTTGENKVAWSDVVSARAFKRDLFMMDCVCLQFTLLNGTVIEVNEDMKGWKNLLSSLPSVLSGFPEVNSWLGKVTLPPFAVQLTELWKKSG
jgi:hypothetical protein